MQQQRKMETEKAAQQPVQLQQLQSQGDQIQYILQLMPNQGYMFIPTEEFATIHPNSNQKLQFVAGNSIIDRSQSPFSSFQTIPTSSNQTISVRNFIDHALPQGTFPWLLNASTQQSTNANVWTTAPASAQPANVSQTSLQNGSFIQSKTPSILQNNQNIQSITQSTNAASTMRNQSVNIAPKMEVTHAAFTLPSATNAIQASNSIPTQTTLTYQVHPQMIQSSQTESYKPEVAHSSTGGGENIAEPHNTDAGNQTTMFNIRLKEEDMFHTPSILQNNQSITQATNAASTMKTQSVCVNIASKMAVNQAVLTEPSATIAIRPSDLVQTQTTSSYQTESCKSKVAHSSTGGVNIAEPQKTDTRKGTSTAQLQPQKQQQQPSPPRTDVKNNLALQLLSCEQQETTSQQVPKKVIPHVIGTITLENDSDTNNEKEIDQSFDEIQKTFTNNVPVTEMDQLPSVQEMLTPVTTVTTGAPTVEEVVKDKIPPKNGFQPSVSLPRIDEYLILAGKLLPSCGSSLLLKQLQLAKNNKENKGKVNDIEDLSTEKQITTDEELKIFCTQCGKKYSKAKHETTSKNSEDINRNGNENIDSPEERNTNPSENMNRENPVEWTVTDVCHFIKEIRGASDYVKEFSRLQIDGEALMLLKEDHLTSHMNICLGVALKIMNKIDALRKPPPSRNKKPSHVRNKVTKNTPTDKKPRGRPKRKRASLCET